MGGLRRQRRRRQGDAIDYGSPTSITDPVASIVPSTDGKGYWFIGRDGNVYPEGDAPYKGSLPGLDVSVGNIVGAVPTGG